MAKLSRAQWKGKFYFRKESGDWREIVNDKIVKAPRGASIQDLRNKEKKSSSWEISRSHNYGGEGLSKEKAKQAVKLFGQENSEQARRIFPRRSFKR